MCSSDLGDFAFAMGDGNHSLAAAKRCWEEMKPTVPESGREGHPARYALVELVNIHDPAVTFEPIHRALIGADTGDFLSAAVDAFTRAEPQGDAVSGITLLCGGEEAAIELPLPLGAAVSLVDGFLTGYTAAFGGEVDYIHGEEETRSLAARSGGAGILLPTLKKEELFPHVARFGPYPKKSFSIGEAREKRYYLEARKIK